MIAIDTLGNIFYMIFLEPVKSKDFGGFLSKLQEVYHKDMGLE